MLDFVDNNNVPDCLVLKLEEIEFDTEKIDNTVYILFDQLKDKYIVRGCRRRLNCVHQSCAYSYECYHHCDLADFLQYMICPTNKVNEVLYNYDNLPYDSNEITYDFLYDYDHQDYEISGYNRQKLNKNKLLKNLRMLRKIFNKF